MIWGNSAAVRPPAALLDQVHLTLGDKLIVDIRPEGIMLAPARPKYSLEERVAQCDLKASVPEDLADWNGTRPVGREAW
nr:PbsX family transcriptional regulator [Caballeronia ptereochthonis]